MATTAAKNKKEVDEMTPNDALWDSLNYSYGTKREESDQSFDKAISQTDRAALGRGMQRSSYLGSVLANLRQQKIKAADDIWNTQIADYETRKTALDQQALENERWERQFAATEEQNAWSRAFQEQQAELNAKNTEQQIAMGYVQTALANGKIPSDDLLARAGLTREDAELMKKQTYSGGGTTTKKPWEQLGMTEAQYNALLAAGGASNPGTTGGLTLADYLAALSNANKPQAEEPKPGNSYRVLINNAVNDLDRLHNDRVKNFLTVK